MCPYEVITKSKTFRFGRMPQEGQGHALWPALNQMTLKESSDRKCWCESIKQTELIMDVRKSAKLPPAALSVSEEPVKNPENESKERAKYIILWKLDLKACSSSKRENIWN